MSNIYIIQSQISSKAIFNKVILHLRSVSDKLSSERVKRVKGTLKFVRLGKWYLCHLSCVQKKHCNLFEAQLKARVSFFFSLLTTVSAQCFASHLTANQWLLSKIMDPGLAGFLQVKWQGLAPEYPRQGEGSQVHGDKKVRDESLNVYLPFYGI